MRDENTDAGKGASQLRRRTLLAWLLLFVFAGVVSLFLLQGNLTSALKPLETPIATANFPDGNVFQVLRAEHGSSFDFLSRRPDPWFRIIKGNRSFTYAQSRLEFEVGQRISGQLEQVECRLEKPTFDALFLLVRLEGANKSEMVSETVVFFDEERSKQIVRDANGGFESFEEVPVSTHPKPEPLYQVDIDDGSGGWIPTHGPLAFDGKDGRSVVIAPGFPRNAPALRLRVTRSDTSDSLDIEIPNPGYDPAGTSAWTPDPKPWGYETPDAKVEITGLEPLRFSGSGKKLPWPQFSVHPHGGQPENAFDVHVSSIEDASGNRIDPLNFWLIPGTKILRYHGEIRRSHAEYRWAPAEVVMAAEGTWTGGASPLTLTLLPGAADVGLQEMTLTPPPSPPDGEWRVGYRGEAPETRIPGDGIVIFLDSEERSDKWTWFHSGGASGSPIGNWSYDYTSDWEGTIAKGQKVRIGFLPEVRSETFEATLPVPVDWR